ncbi:uncharacterized protein LOC144717295 isoform X1 [Lampetra planeri]
MSIRMACVVATPMLEPSGNFPAWLQAQGVNAEVARAMDSELGIRDYGVLRACVGDGLVRAELLATARDRLPFGFYAMLRQVVKVLQGAEPHDAGTPPWDDAASSPGNVMLGGLVDVLLMLFRSLSRELLLSVDRLGAMDGSRMYTEDSTPPANEGSPEIVMKVEEEHLSECVGEGVSEDDFGITIQTVTSLHSEQVSLNTAAEPDPSSLLQNEAAAKVKRKRADAVTGTECTTLPLSVIRSAHHSTVSLNVEQPNIKHSSELGAVLHHCDQCGQSFSQSGTLKRHQRMRVGVNARGCYAYGQTIRSCRDIGHHSKMHTNDKWWLNESDDKSISQDVQQKHHTFNHARERSFQCAICSRAYTSASQLKDHRRIHTGENLHRCNVCEQAFLRADHLKDHRSVHTGEKPYECKVCGQSFSRATTLKRHQLVHTGEKPYRCEACGKAFSLAAALKAHCFLHTEGKKYQCGVCNKAFAQPDYLRKHRKKMHVGGMDMRRKK